MQINRSTANPYLQGSEEYDQFEDSLLAGDTVASRMKQPFIMVPSRLLYSVSPKALALYMLYIDTGFGGSNKSTLCNKTICDRMGWSVPTVRKAKAELIEAGAIIAVPRFRRDMPTVRTSDQIVITDVSEWQIEPRWKPGQGVGKNLSEGSERKFTSNLDCLKESREEKKDIAVSTLDVDRDADASSTSLVAEPETSSEEIVQPLLLDVRGSHKDMHAAFLAWKKRNATEATTPEIIAVFDEVKPYYDKAGRKPGSRANFARKVNAAIDMGAKLGDIRSGAIAYLKECVSARRWPVDAENIVYDGRNRNAPGLYSDHMADAAQDGEETTGKTHISELIAKLKGHWKTADWSGLIDMSSDWAVVKKHVADEFYGLTAEHWEILELNWQECN